MPTPNDIFAFTDALADVLRLPDETLAMSYIYMNKYHRFQRTSQTPDPLDPYAFQKSILSVEFHPALQDLLPPPRKHPSVLTANPLLPSTQTLSLSTISLASKSTESPRRLSSILLPAHTLLHPATTTEDSPRQRLTVPSPAYDALRTTLVQAELILLRVLGFELHLASPLEYLPRYLARAVEDVERVGEGFDDWDRETKDEYGVLGGLMEGRVGRACRGRVVDACKDYGLANLFPPRAVALGVMYVVLGEKGLTVRTDVREWVKEVGSGKVDGEDFEEVVEVLGKV